VGTRPNVGARNLMWTVLKLFTLGFQQWRQPEIAAT
jgi:hypothetical protein